VRARERSSSKGGGKETDDGCRILQAALLEEVIAALLAVTLPVGLAGTA
jgi:hypothetical protein